MRFQAILALALLAGSAPALPVSNLFVRGNAVVALDDWGSTLTVTNSPIGRGAKPNTPASAGVWIKIEWFTKPVGHGSQTCQTRPAPGWFVFVEDRYSIWSFDGRDGLVFNDGHWVEGKGVRLPMPKTCPVALRTALPSKVIKKYFGH